jgi:hypothetical protein
MKPEDFVPEGSMVVARIEIIEVITPQGNEASSFVAVDGNGDALSRIKFLGMLMDVMLDGYNDGHDDDDEEIE